MIANKQLENSNLGLR